MSLIASPQALARKGILSMNRRNLTYIQRFNSRENYPKADDKLLTKQLATAAGIAVPSLYRVVETVGELKALDTYLRDLDDFVIKPAHGSGGDGVVVVLERRDGAFHRANGQTVSIRELKHHTANILHGLFSLGGQPDRALIEYRVQFDPLFEKITYRGVPDVRIIVFLGVPVMAMLRLPTKASNGRANLHQGAVGVGIDIATGVTRFGVCRDQPVDVHPDTGSPIAGVQVPQWDRLLEIAASCYELSGLGYLGADIVFDSTLGPLMLELNARPGLAIQIANRLGLDQRLGQVLRAKPEPGQEPAKRALLAKRLFDAEAQPAAAAEN
ncbi:MAG: alpha-L-glutamate ligase-like protein [Bdellovibrionales bacterium]|nr:alpha-L-glutamate ligase-like protein [Bdellovibrionales bacterium]